MKEFEYEDEQAQENADQRCDDSCSLNHSETASWHEMEALFARSLQKIHEWYDMSVYYVYFKEKILGKKGKTGKKNNYQWIETNDIYVEYRLPATIKTDRDSWISAAETVTQITKDDTPVLREKWVASISCHFEILSLDEACQNLGVNLTCEQLAELALEHCCQRGMPVPIIWEDGEELTLVWALETPYYRAVEENDRYIYDPKTDMWYDDEYKFNPQWDKVQTWLYEDLRYLGANPKRKHILTMLRVPGTLNTRTNMPVRILHDSEKISLSDLTNGLLYVRERLRKNEPIEPPDLSKLLQEYKEFMKFCDDLDKTTGESEPKRKARKAKTAASKAQKPKKSRKVNPVIEEFARRTSENPILRKIPMDRWDKYNEFVDQLRKDILLIHPESDKYVCLCVKKGEKWQQLWVQAKDLERKLTELWLRPDFNSNDIYDSQAEYLSCGSREVNKVYSVRAGYLDLDGKYTEEHKDLSPEDWVKVIIAFCEGKKVPVPTIMVYSGNGIHVKWLYKDAVTGENLKKFERLEKKLQKLFAELGADIKATDLARVLRVPGTKNCKPETTDRDVRVVNLTSETYDFEEFLALIDELVPSEGDEMLSEQEIESLPIEEVVVDNYPAFYVQNETTGTLERVKKSEMQDYLGLQDKAHVLRSTIAEFVGQDLKTAHLKRIYCNCVKLSSSKVPGATFEEKATAIRIHCQQYRGVGFPEANVILEYDDSLIAIWKYVSEDKLPARALSRWKRTQEDICEYFADWGAKDDPEYQEVTVLLPIAGFTGDTKGISRSKASYTFDSLARKVLPYSQPEVKEYKAKKAEEKAKKAAERPVRRKHISKGQKSGNFGRMAESRFGDIWHLFDLRKDERGEIPQGHRESSVFWGMNFAVEAGKVTNLAEFDALTQEVIDENGLQFRSECSVRTLTTLRGRFARGEDVYKAETATLIEDLGITPAEQEELEVLREYPKKEKKTSKPKAPSLESLKLWEKEGISRRTFYYRRKAEKEAKARQEQARRLFMAMVIEHIVNRLYISEVYNCTARAYIMRGIECVCMCVSQWGMISILGGEVFRVQQKCESAFGDAEKTITAIVEKTGMEYTALKADRTVSRGECLKQVTPPPVPSNDIRQSGVSAFGDAEKTITAIVEKTGMEYTALKADRTVSRGECLKQVTPPPVPSNDIRQNVK